MIALLAISIRRLSAVRSYARPPINVRSTRPARALLIHWSEVPNDRQLILESMGTPGAYCLFPTTRPLTQKELVDCVKIL